MNVYSKKINQLIKSRIINMISIPNDLFGYLTGLIILSGKARQYGFPIKGLIPIIGNNHAQAGIIDKHYFMQDIYFARKIAGNTPINHYDIGSRVDGFISHLICIGINVTMIDIRPLDIYIPELKFIQSDATSLANIGTGEIMSLSTLHAVEHFGLSRYGDKLDIEASRKAIKEFQRVIGTNGLLYFSVPISNANKIIYNSHRVFKPLYIISEFESMELVSFAYIRNYQIYEYTGADAVNIITANQFEEYDCGMFIFRKK